MEQILYVQLPSKDLTVPYFLQLSPCPDPTPIVPHNKVLSSSVCYLLVDFYYIRLNCLCVFRAHGKYLIENK